MKKQLFLLLLSLSAQQLFANFVGDSELQDETQKMLGLYARRVQNFADKIMRAKELEAQLAGSHINKPLRAELQERLSLILQNTREVQDSLDKIEAALEKSINNVVEEVVEAGVVKTPMRNENGVEVFEKASVIPLAQEAEATTAQEKHLAAKGREFDAAFASMRNAVSDMERSHALEAACSGGQLDFCGATIAPDYFAEDEEFAVEQFNAEDSMPELPQGFELEECPKVVSTGAANSYAARSVQHNGQAAGRVEQIIAVKPIDQDAWHFVAEQRELAPGGEVACKCTTGTAQEVEDLL